MKFNKPSFLRVAIIFVFTVLCLVTVTACNSTDSLEGSTLTVYSTFDEDFARPFIDLFEEETGIHVDVIFAGTGALLNRIREEADDSSAGADLLWGGALFSVLPEADLFEDFVSDNEEFVISGMENTEGTITRIMSSARLLMINTDLIGDIEINGYACLLNPALRGQIAITDPAASGSSFNHLINQLYAMGHDNNPNLGWDYMDDFIQNLGGIMLGDSSAVHQGVANGNFIVGLTYEEAPFTYIEEGYPVRVVYIDEGIIGTSSGAAVIKDAPNRDAAHVFINFITSFDAQAMMERDLFRRPVRSDIPSTGGLIANADLKWIAYDTSYIIENRETWLDSFRELWEKYS